MALLVLGAFRRLLPRRIVAVCAKPASAANKRTRVSKQEPGDGNLSLGISASTSRIAVYPPILYLQDVGGLVGRTTSGVYEQFDRRLRRQRDDPLATPNYVFWIVFRFYAPYVHQFITTPNSIRMVSAPIFLDHSR